MIPDAQSKLSPIRALWWWIALVLAIAFGCGHAAMVARYLDRVNQERFHEAPRDGAERDITLGVAADGRTWLRLTEERIEHGDWRLSRTKIDGGRDGRAVYWHSAWSWWLETLGRTRAHWTGESLPRAIERASVWAQLPLWLAAVGAGGWWALRRWGPGAAALFVATLAGHRGFYVACYPAYPDHHGVIAATALALTLGVCSAGFRLSGGGGRAPRIWTIVSALAGAAGLAFSAASLVPVLAGIGVALILCRNAARRAFGEEETRKTAALWRLWGRLGALAALALYLLEFFPDRLGWRLEVNHPLYALAWWGGGEFLAWWWSRDTVRDGRRPRSEWLLPAMALAAVATPLVAAIVGRADCFLPLDRFIAGVHGHITEFFPLWKMEGSSAWLLVASLAPAVLAPWAWRRLPKRERVALLALAVLAGLLLALAIWQHRWWSLAAAAQAPLAALVGAAFFSGPRGWRPTAAIVSLFLVALAGPVLLLVEQTRVAGAHDVQAADAMQLLYRDLGRTVRESMSEESPVLLASPEASVGVGYYGGLRAPGTLYWENGDGLRLAARVLTSTDDAAAERELLGAGVTHLLVVEPGDFTAEYLDALGREGPDVPKLDSTLGRRLLAGRQVPTWARALAYAVPPQFARLGVRVALYGFVPAQTPAESKRALGVARLVAGDESAGRVALREAAELGSPEAALVLAWRMATSGTLPPGEAADALRLAEGAVASLPEAAANRRVLAACYAAAGRWPEAQGTILRALDLAQEAGDSRAVSELEGDFIRYRDLIPPGAPKARGVR